MLVCDDLLELPRVMCITLALQEGEEGEHCAVYPQSFRITYTLDIEADTGLPSPGPGWYGIWTVEGETQYVTLVDQGAGFLLASWGLGLLQSGFTCEDAIAAGTPFELTTDDAVVILFGDPNCLLTVTFSEDLTDCPEDDPDPPPAVSYNCVDDSCVDPGDGTGTYATLAECIAAPCEPDGPLDCESAGCVAPRTWTATISGFVGDCEDINGEWEWEFSHMNAGLCIYVAVLGDIASELMIYEGIFSVGFTGTGTGEGGIPGFDATGVMDCCAEVVLTFVGNGSCDDPPNETPATITLTPGEACP